MSYFEDVYVKRVNRFGNDYQERMQNQREKEFDNYLKGSIYATTFEYSGNTYDCIFEPYKQDETETLHYLLTRVSLDVAAGSVLVFKDNKQKEHHWLVYWKEDYKISGYNRYILLKADSNISWIDDAGATQSSYGYLYGPGNAAITDTIKSSGFIFHENSNEHYFITPVNSSIKKDISFNVTTKDLSSNNITQGFRITGFDVVSTPGIQYVTVDPIYIVNTDPIPEKKSTDKDEDFFWLKSGEYNNKQARG